ncbi:MAG: hypothetical protein LBQ84_04175 [Flavobacteriaceae bacterium]|jgi:hypothetical protein|nr:hypothetical protein [Flavobacteriaceae bacterium]
MKKIIPIILSVVFLSFYAYNPNDFYTSITRVEYVSSNKTLKISSKVNSDHLEQVLGKKHSAGDFDAALNRYLQSNVKISINDIPVNFTFSSKNPDGNVIWIYYETSDVSSVSSITVKNTLLMDKFPDQQNFINFIVNGQKKSLVCKKGAETGKINF